MAISSEKITEILLSCAREEKFDRHELVVETCHIAAHKFPQKIVTMVTALLVSGALVEENDIVKIGKFAESRYGDNQAYLDRISEIEGQCNELRRKLKEVVVTAEQGIKAANDRADAMQAQTRIVEVQIKSGEKKIKSVKGLFHTKFERLLSLAKMRKNIFIYGPTGCGKSYVCSQLADALNLPFYFVSCTCGMSEGQLSGRLLPVGKQGTFEYIIGEFVKAYEQGGVFLLDEIDAADPNVLLIINSALANGSMAVPNRPSKPYAKRHKDFICIAAANTIGTGADRLYPGRNKLDGSTLDRFAIGKVFMDYDEQVEKELCPDDELRVKLTGYRVKIRQHRMERAMSTRFMQDAYDMKTGDNWTHDMIDQAFFEGWREDERNKVKMN
jgi:midasin (ATPase involved in ribosome maturation)